MLCYVLCRRRDLNPHEEIPPPPQDGVSTNSTTSALEIIIYIKKNILSIEYNKFI